MQYENKRYSDYKCGSISAEKAAKETGFKDVKEFLEWVKIKDEQRKIKYD